jgi:repressor LexA
VKDSFRALEVLTFLDREYDHNPAVRMIPILGRIAAGTPLLAVENMEGHLQVDSTFIRSDETFALRVRGDSMIEDHIVDGDYVLIKRQAMADKGDTVAVMIDDDVTLKKFFPRTDYIELVPANASMNPIRISRGDKQIRIVGKMVGLLRKT